MDAQLLNIAQRILGLHTFEPFGLDRLDFIDVSKWQVREALEAAYILGTKSKEDTMSKELKELIMNIDERFKSANDIQVERSAIRAVEWQLIKKALNLEDKNVKV